MADILRDEGLLEVGSFQNGVTKRKVLVSRLPPVTIPGVCLFVVVL